MTKSTITREQLEEWVAQFDEDGGCDATDRQLEALIRQSLAAMDSEPVGKPFMYGIADPDGNAYIDDFCVSEDLGLVEDTVTELNYDREEGDELNYSVVALYRHTQPAPVVPEKCPAEIRDQIASHSDALFNDDDAQEIWNACRAAMLQAQPQNAPQNIPEIIPDSCTWTFSNYDDCWTGTCGVEWIFPDGGPEENGVKFCPRCGKPTSIKQ